MKLSLFSKIALAASGLAAVLLAGEAMARVYYRWAYNVPLLATMRIHGDTSFGWEGRQWDGGPQYPRVRIMVVGDSITDGYGAAEPSNLYYGVLGRSLKAYVWSYGGLGYGTLQEYMVIDRYLAAVRPDLVLLQVTSNDFINNVWSLERRSYYNTNLMVRPYAVGDGAVFLFPSRLGGALYPAMVYSRLVYELAFDVTRAGAKLANAGAFRSAEEEIIAHGVAYGPFRESIAVTEFLIAKIKARLGGLPLVAFAADDPWPYIDQWRAIFERQGVPLIEEAAIRVREGEERSGQKLRFDGAHWNAAGHRLVGEVLAVQLANRLPR